MGQQGNILIVDDEEDSCKLLRYNLKIEGFNVSLQKYASEINQNDLVEVRIVIVDAMQQEFTGMELIQQIKTNPKTQHIPVILTCIPDGEELIIRAFEYGVDDFITKPYSLREMLARINSVLRRYPLNIPLRTTKVIEGITIKHLDLHIDTTNHRVLKAGTIVPLTKTEYSIFEFLIKNHNNFYTRDQIYSEVWKEDSNINTRIVDTNISRLRKKLGSASKSIINRYGMGYAFVDKVS